MLTSCCPAPAVHRGGQLLLLSVALVLGMALPARAQTLHLHADWIPDFTAPDSPTVCATGGAVGGYLRLRVRFQMPTGANNASINSFTVHEVAGCYPDSGGTQGWEATTARPECGDPPGSGWRFWTLEWTPATAQLHNGPHELTVKVAYGGPLIGGPHYAQTSITLDLQNTLITATSPANPDPILWDPERMQSVPVSVTVQAAYRHAKQVTLRIFDSEQNEVRVLEQVTDVGGVRDGQVQASTVSFQWDGKNGMGQTMPRGVYLFRFQVTNEPNTPYDGDTDKSTFLSICRPRTDAEVAESTESGTVFRVTYALAGDVPARSGRILVFDPLAPDADNPVATHPLRDSQLALGEHTALVSVPGSLLVGRYRFLLCAQDGDAQRHKSHDCRWTLQHNQQAGYFPAAVFGFTGFGGIGATAAQADDAWNQLRTGYWDAGRIAAVGSRSVGRHGIVPVGLLSRQDYPDQPRINATAYDAWWHLAWSAYDQQPALLWAFIGHGRRERSLQGRAVQFGGHTLLVTGATVPLPRGWNAAKVEDFAAGALSDVWLCVLGSCWGSQQDGLDAALRARGVQNTVAFNREVQTTVARTWWSYFWKYLAKQQQGVWGAARAAQLQTQKDLNKGYRPYNLRSWVVVNGRPVDTDTEADLD